ncbi:unnamed protein product, partial [Trichogramma brassicae]
MRRPRASFASRRFIDEKPGGRLNSRRRKRLVNLTFFAAKSKTVQQRTEAEAINTTFLQRPTRALLSVDLSMTKLEPAKLTEILDSRKPNRTKRKKNGSGIRRRTCASVVHRTWCQAKPDGGVRYKYRVAARPREDHLVLPHLLIYIFNLHFLQWNLRSRDPRISYADISSSRRSAPTMMQRSSRQPAPGQPAVVQHQLVSANQHQQHEGGAAEFHPALLADHQQQVAGSVPPTVQQQVQVPPPGPIDGHQQQVAASALQHRTMCKYLHRVQSTAIGSKWQHQHLQHCTKCKHLQCVLLTVISSKCKHFHQVHSTGISSRFKHLHQVQSTGISSKCMHLHQAQATGIGSHWQYQVLVTRVSRQDLAMGSTSLHQQDLGTDSTILSHQQEGTTCTSRSQQDLGTVSSSLKHHQEGCNLYQPEPTESGYGQQQPEAPSRRYNLYQPEPTGPGYSQQQPQALQHRYNPYQHEMAPQQRDWNGDQWLIPKQIFSYVVIITVAELVGMQNNILYFRASYEFPLMKTTVPRNRTMKFHLSLFCPQNATLIRLSLVLT